jgi:prepilin-type N-terminal cleavage/methylation domain-containing protein
MVSLLNCTNNQKETTGFTLIEVLVVLGIVSVLLSSTLFFNFDTYRGDAFRAEGKILQSLLQTARADAMNNIGQQPHGVALHPDGYNGYVIFEGEDYAHADIHTLVQIPESYHISLSLDSPHEIVFSQLSGDADFQGEIILIDAERQASTSIYINYEGNISY